MNSESQITIEEIISSFGGIRPLARKLGFVHPMTVQHWKKMGYISAWHHDKIITLARKEKVKLKKSQLTDLYRNKKPPKQKAPTLGLRFD